MAVANNFIPLDTLGDTLKVQTGDPFFITMRINSLNHHPDPADGRTEFAVSAFRVAISDENYLLSRPSKIATP